jgi:hypothetical protein
VPAHIGHASGIRAVAIPYPQRGQRRSTIGWAGAEGWAAASGAASMRGIVRMAQA